MSLPCNPCPRRPAAAAALLLLLLGASLAAPARAGAEGPQRAAPAAAALAFHQPADPISLENLEPSLSRLKADYESSLAPVKDPRIIKAISLRDAALAHFMAVTAAEPDLYSGYYAEQSALLERLWSGRRATWEMREVDSLIMYSEALSRLVVILAGKRDNTKVLAEFAAASRAPASGRAKSQPAKIAEARVYWSNRAAVLTALLIKVAAPDRLRELEDITDDLLNRAEVIAARRDVHYQARMDLLYLNNVQSLTGMLFLMATDSRSPFLGAAAAMEDSWERRIADPDFQVSEKTSLSLVSNTQLSFPLLYWIASGQSSPPPRPPRRGRK